MVALHHTPTPRLPDSCHGHAVQYGEPGDRCVCGARLSSYNEYDACQCCLGERGVRARKRQKRRAPASACSEAVPTAAPEPRRVSREVLEMAAEERRKYGDVKGRVWAIMDDGHWHGGTELAGIIGCSDSTVCYHLQRMAESGACETRPGPKGGHQYRLRSASQAPAVSPQAPNGATDAPAVAADCDKTAPATSPAPSPAAEPELPACEAPAPDPAAEAVAEPEPAVGDGYKAARGCVTPREGWTEKPEETIRRERDGAGPVTESSYQMPPATCALDHDDTEVRALYACVRELRGLDIEARRRVLDYLACRFVVDGKEA